MDIQEGFDRLKKKPPKTMLLSYKADVLSLDDELNIAKSVIIYFECMSYKIVPMYPSMAKIIL